MCICTGGASIGQRVQYEGEWLHGVNEEVAAVGGNYRLHVNQGLFPTARCRSETCFASYCARVENALLGRADDKEHALVGPC